MEILKVENLSFSYPSVSVKSLDGLSFSVERGDFVAVCGATGSGKSTLLRMLKREITPLGERTGEIYYNSAPLSALSERESGTRIGYVMQRPEQQIVTDKVWHELAFGLENMGVPTDTIRRRVSEMACYFGIEDWFEKGVDELSGGQKQLLNLASVMVMQPDILLLDEPTSQLDPIAASDFIATVAKLNRELSLTVIIVEHRLEDVIPVSNRLLALDSGKLFAFGETRECVRRLRENEAMLEGMPAAVRLFSRFDVKSPCPLDVREGRAFVENSFTNSVRSLGEKEYTHSPTVALEFGEVCFRYERALPDVLRSTTFRVYENEVFCILGGNGSGKSTALSAAAALIKPYSGNIKVFGKKLREYINQSLYINCLSLLPQDVQTVFLHNTVRLELEDAKADLSTLPFDLSDLLDRHPYDLSGGQQQLVALAKVLASKPRLLLLDEPTKGLDAHTRNAFIGVIKRLRDAGTTVVCVTHDVEFAALCADRCAMFFRGEITSCDVPRRFFAFNCFYTTAANRMTRGYYDLVSTLDDAVAVIEANERRGGV